jgi:hypothetical protein
MADAMRAGMEKAGTIHRTEGSRYRRFAAYLSMVLAACLGLAVSFANAQTGGQGALEGEILDPTRAVIASATITATNQASRVSTTVKSTSAGVYEITPLIPGVYTISVAAKGFRDFEQENIEVNGLTITGYNAVLTVGAEDQTIVVTEAPPQLQTTNATLGGVVTNETYESLPVLMNLSQRDPTAWTACQRPLQTCRAITAWFPFRFPLNP